MELSGLIFVALAVVWAVVLLPMALRHHDEAAKTRAVDRFSDNLRVVARREAVGAREARLVPAAVPARTGRRRPPIVEQVPAEQVPAETATAADPVSDAQVAERSVEPTPAAEQSLMVEPVETSLVAAHRASAAAAAHRRRRVLGVLLAALVAVGAGSFFGLLQPWAPVIPAAMTVAFLVLARVLVRRETARWQSLVTARRNAQRGAGASAVVEPVTPAAPVAPVAQPEPAPVRRADTAFLSGLDDTSSIPVALVANGPRSDLWDPLPVTLPTYVTKPRATRSVRTIDLRDTDVVSSGRDAGDSALVAEAAAASADAEQEERRAFGS